MNHKAQTIKKGRKYDQVIAGAREVFMADGYEGASVDEIARAANVSKATLYSYFSDKEALFTRVASTECLAQAEAAAANIDKSQPVEKVLHQAACHSLRFFLSDFGMNIYRICVSESARFPELGRTFYATGPAVAQTLLTAYLEEATARGELTIGEDEMELAGHQFIELCRAGLFHKKLFFVQEKVSPAEIEAVCDGAVKTFLARYKA